MTKLFGFLSLVTVCIQQISSPLLRDVFSSALPRKGGEDSIFI